MKWKEIIFKINIYYFEKLKFEYNILNLKIQNWSKKLNNYSIQLKPTVH